MTARAKFNKIFPEDLTRLNPTSEQPLITSEPIFPAKSEMRTTLTEQDKELLNPISEGFLIE